MNGPDWTIYKVNEQDSPENTEIYFSGESSASWIMRIITKKNGLAKIQFNHADHPELAENEFAEKVIEILENFLKNG